MDSRCLRCNRSFGRNAEVDRLPFGRKFAFDSEKGRLWVVCSHCDQWNLVPIEERWEAVESCDRLAAEAEARVGTGSVGFARTASGLELLRVGGLSDPDIANWRYGRRLAHRQSAFRLLGAALVVLGLTLGLRAGVDSQSLAFGGYVAVCAIVYLGFMWRDPPRLLPTAVRFRGTRALIWPWHRNAIGVATDGEHPAVTVPRRGSEARLVGHEAAQFLADMLPSMNGSSCADASIREAVARVNEAERGAWKRSLANAHNAWRHGRARDAGDDPVVAPWELIAVSAPSPLLVRMPPVTRLALEMAATEEVERAMLEARVTGIGAALDEAETIARIADDLLVPDDVAARLNELLRNEKKSP